MHVDLEEPVQGDHPLRAIRAFVTAVPSGLQREFAALCSPVGRLSVQPAELLRATLSPTFYSIRSERLFMERLEDDLAGSSESALTTQSEATSRPSSWPPYWQP